MFADIAWSQTQAPLDPYTPRVCFPFLSEKFTLKFQFDASKLKKAENDPVIKIFFLSAIFLKLAVIGLYLRMQFFRRRLAQGPAPGMINMLL